MNTKKHGKISKPVAPSLWKQVVTESIPFLGLATAVIFFLFVWDDIVDWLEEDVEYTIELAKNVYEYIAWSERTTTQKLMLICYMGFPFALAAVIRRFIGVTSLPEDDEDAKKTKLNINQPNPRAKTNAIKTTRYSKYTLIPLVLLEQMTKPDNIYFEIVVYLQVVYPELSPTGRHSTYPGLVLTFVWKIISVAIEQIFLWYDDMQENIEPYKKLAVDNSSYHNSDTFQWVRSEDIKQGDIIYISEDEPIPFDGVALASSQNSMFQLNMSLLNGEISPHKKYPLDWNLSPSDIKQISENEDFKFFKNMRGYVECSAPTHLLDVFTGVVKTKDNTEVPFGTKNAVYRGTKMKGSEWILVYVVYTGHLTKVGKLFKKVALKQTVLDNEFVKNLKFNFTILGLLISFATFYGIFSGKVAKQFEDIIIEIAINFLHLNGLNNLSSQLMADMVRIGQRRQIVQDKSVSVLVNRKDVLDEIVEELVTDKTGTLTENSLILVRLVIGDVLYDVSHFNSAIESINDFDLIKAMSFCHDVTPRNDEMLFSTVEDLKFVSMARQYGFHLLERTENSVSVAELKRGEVHHYDILGFNEFESRKKHMSIVLRKKKSGIIELWFKGADRETYPRLDPKDPKNASYKANIEEHTKTMTNQGLRVLIWAKRTIAQSEYDTWQKNHQELLKREDLDEKEKVRLVDKSWDLIEQKLTLIGATAIEDKLQPNVKRVLKFCKSSNIRVSVATGDSENTATAIMRHLDQIKGEPMFLVSDSVGKVDEHTLKKNLETIKALPNDDTVDRTIVVDGKTLAVITEKHRDEFAGNLLKFKTRIFARVSAIQKAEIVLMLKSINKRVFAIGDGNNDTTMIQEADFGVGIRGIEGHQAASAADFQVTRFQEIQTVLSHSLRAHFRLSTVYLWNDYKAVVIALTAYLSRAIQGFQGDALIPGEIIFCLNTLDLAYPVVLFGLFDNMIPFDKLLREPQHYWIGQKLLRYNGKRKLIWWLHAVLHALAIVAVSRFFLHDKALALMVGVSAGQIVSIISNFRLMMECRRWNWIVMGSAWSSIILLSKFARLNPFGSRKVPPLNFKYIVLTSGLCVIIDILLMWIADERPPILTQEFWKSVWDEWIGAIKKVYEWSSISWQRASEQIGQWKKQFGVGVSKRNKKKKTQ